MSVPEYFKGAVLVQTGQDLKIFDRIVIPELKRGQVLVRMGYAGLCHSQLMEITGQRGKDPYLPHLLGHEGTGEVVKVGEGVTKVRSGDKVVLGWIKGNGLEGGGSIYQTADGTRINGGPVTTFSEYSVVSENRTVLRPSNTPEHLAVLYGCALPTGAGLVFNQLKPNKDAHIAIVGLGGIGLSALIACKIFEPKSLIAIDLEEDKLMLAKNLGATHVINAAEGKILEKVCSLLEGEGVDYAIEAAGLTKTIELGFSLIRREGGELIFASHPKAGEKIELDPFELICGKSIRGTWGGGSFPDRDIPLLDRLYGEGKLDLESLVGGRFSLEDINQAFEHFKSGKAVRTLLEIVYE